MKLSKKGAERLANSCFTYDVDSMMLEHLDENLDDFEFNQDDFEGVVVLSLDDVDTLIETMLEAERRIDDYDTQDALNQSISFLGKEYAKRKNCFNERRKSERSD